MLGIAIRERGGIRYCWCQKERISICRINSLITAGQKEIKMKNSVFLLVCVSLVFFLPVYGFQSYGQEAMEHSVIKPMPKSVLIPAQSEKSKFSSYSFYVKKGKKRRGLKRKANIGDFVTLSRMPKDELTRVFQG